MKTLLITLCCFCSFTLFSQTGFVSGIVTNQAKEPVVGVNITYHDKGVITDENGAYNIEIPINQKTTIKFSHLGYKTLIKNFKGYKNKTIKYFPVLNNQSQDIEEVTIKSYENAHCRAQC